MSISVYIYSGVLGVVAGLVSALAVWTALASVHWILRATMLLAALCVLLLVEAYDTVLFFTAQMLLIVILIRLLRSVGVFRARRRNRNGEFPASEPWRFTLKDLMRFTLLAAGFSAVVAFAARNTLSISWTGYAENLAYYVIVPVLIATLLFSCGKGVRLAAVAMAGTLVVWLALVRVQEYDWLDLWNVTGEFYMQIAVAAFGTAAVILLLCAVALWGRSCSDLERQARTARWRRPVGIGASSLLVVLLLALAAPLGWLFWKMVSPPPPPIVPDTPNAYPELIALAARLHEVPFEDEATEKNISRYLKKSAATLDAAHEVLRQPFFVTYNLKPRRFSEENFDYVSHNRNMARAFVLKGQMAEKDGRVDEAIACHLDAITLGIKSTKGGLLIDELVGDAVQRIGMGGLACLRPKLSARQCRRLVKQLGELMNTKQPVDRFLQRDARYHMHAYGWVGRLWAIIEELDNQRTNKSGQTIVTLRKRSDALLAMLVTDLAIRAYQAEKGRLPATLDQLVPDYLDEVPRDPFGFALKYRQGGEGDYALYSVGENGSDDAGIVTDGIDAYRLPEDMEKLKKSTQPLSYDPGQGDLVLDVWIWQAQEDFVTFFAPRED